MADSYWGWKASTAFKKLFGKEGSAVEGSSDELKQWKELVEALYDDHQKLLVCLQDQQARVVKLRRGLRIALVFGFLGMALSGILIYGTYHYLKPYAADQAWQMAEMQARLKTVEASAQTGQETENAWAARLTKLEEEKEKAAAPPPVSPAPAIPAAGVGEPPPEPK